MDDVDHADQLDALIPIKERLGRGSLIIVTTREYEVLKISGWNGLHIWERLLNKCLVELDDYNCIRMHDHLRDLGKEIGSQHSPCRLWLSQQITKFDKQTEKKNVIRGIKLVPYRIEERWSYRVVLEPNISGEILLLTPYLAGLKLLVIRGDSFNQVINEISRELLWLRWWDIGQRNPVAGLSWKNLRVLQFYEHYEGEHHLEELWEAESDAPVQLRELDISHCHKFQSFPNSIGCLSELKRIVINGENNVETLPAEFCHLRSLEHLVLPHCQMSSLPISFGNLTNLRYLELRDCCNLRRLPITFKNLALLQYLNLDGCRQLILMPDDFQNITELEFLRLYECERVEELPDNITNQVSLKELNLSGMTRLRELPVQIGGLRRLQKMKIGCFPYAKGSILKSLPNSLGNLSSTDLSIMNCPNLEYLPPSLGDLFFLTNLAICQCPKLKCLPFSVGGLNLLECLGITECPISQLDFETASLPSTMTNLKRLFLQRTELYSISISEDRCPHLELLDIAHNYHLNEIEALPVKLGRLVIKSCPKLDVLPRFARLISLRDYEVRDCDRIEKIEGLKYCTRLETLRLHTCWEVPGIESLEQMVKLRTLDMRANKGSAIASCIQTLKKWPDEIIICVPAVSDASSLLDSFKLGLSPNLSVVDSFSYKDVWYKPELLRNRFSNRNAIMLCYVINSVDSSQINIDLQWCEKTISGEDGEIGYISSMGIDEGTWALIGVFTQRSQLLNAEEDLSRRAFRLSADKRRGRWAVEVERGLAVTGEEQSLVQAFCHLIY
ncbi:hypothetical protein SUGI_1127000 [Cryptomeria japonica]|nr:hypothetical protein SUGI_1127000 [Cryptomeria japonica]